jgi:hypothetical protein
MYSGNVGNLRMVHDCKEIADIDTIELRKSRVVSDPACPTETITAAFAFLRPL